jgi:hypothetical protein
MTYDNLFLIDQIRSCLYASGPQGRRHHFGGGGRGFFGGSDGGIFLARAG